ncbi:MAG: Cobalamin biosynthesis protein CobT-like protein [Berkelbacteria bacterium GW2011_GWA1_36_9]|uniref:Cobalamin biosynthesis protein CobT-like protein n=1 Tax=Berkelbacteria bacterium GW2011_GWA1_36_9 TaxID=1618331 RepID=A0A0G0IRR0_9BACT|nr:MAG: Cobalamin biosynthesis protein CobT-like protein [Berkelbacteria bacterium GW2011_GWA1_36_9]
MTNPEGFNPTEDYEKLADDSESLPLFSEEQKQEIEQKRQILSSLAYFIGKDFQIPVELNEPGKGWHWDFKENKIRIDPKDLLEKPMDYLRFVISHEGGHRRVSRTDFIPLDTWQKPGFSFMMNAIEDPRDNNFVAESYPKFAEQIPLGYEWLKEMEEKISQKAQEKLGYQPRFKQAGFEYIKQWFREHQGEDLQISEDLPDEVKEVVEKTLASAQDSWWWYPSRTEADSSEELISRYAEKSYEINRDQIWPEFQKLVEKDLEDEKMQELLKDIEQGKGEGQELPQELKDDLTSEEQKALEEAIESASAKATADKKVKQDGEESDEESQLVPINMDSLSEELKQKIKDYLDSLPDDKKQELADKAQKAMKDFEKELAEELEGKLSENPKEKAEREAKESPEPEMPAQEEKGAEKSSWKEGEEAIRKTQEELRRKMEESLEGGKINPYEIALAKVAPLIDALTGDLRDIFVKRKTTKMEAGYRHGRRWNVKKRIQEKAANIPLLKTESREQLESRSEEKDYAVTLLIDLSGSMMGEKIKEAFKSAIVLAETLQNLDIKFEIVGFQDILMEFKQFEDELNDETRVKLNQLQLEVQGNNPNGHNNPGDNDDGVCLSEASSHLADQQPTNKFLIVLSDGRPEASGKSQSQLDRELKAVVQEITQNTDQKLIGIGLLSNAVTNYYENNLPNVTTEKMVETLGELLRNAIEKY